MGPETEYVRPGPVNRILRFAAGTGILYESDVLHNYATGMQDAVAEGFANHTPAYENLVAEHGKLYVDGIVSVGNDLPVWGILYGISAIIESIFPGKLAKIATTIMRYAGFGYCVVEELRSWNPESSSTFAFGDLAVFAGPLLYEFYKLSKLYREI